MFEKPVITEQREIKDIHHGNVYDYWDHTVRVIFKSYRTTDECRLSNPKEWLIGRIADMLNFTFADKGDFKTAMVHFAKELEDKAEELSPTNK